MRFSLLRGDDFLALEFETLDMQLESAQQGRRSSSRRARNLA